MASAQSDAADTQSDGSDSPILVERPGPPDLFTSAELASRGEGAAAAGGSEAKADDSSAGPPCSDGSRGDGRKDSSEGRTECAEPRGEAEGVSAVALASPSTAKRRERGAGGASEQGGAAVAVGQGEVALAVGQVAANVAGFASSAGAEAAAVVSSLSERVTGFSTGFVSLFSVFDSAVAYPSDSTQGGSAAAHSSGGADGSSAGAEQGDKARAGSSDGSGGSGGGGAGSAEAESGEGMGESARAHHPSRAIDLQAIFGLPTNETLLEAFPCRLLQLYRPVHNSLTPDMRRAFRGTLYVTEQHVCLCLDDSARRIPIKLEASEVGGVVKHSARRGETSDQLKMELTGAHSSLVLQDFASPDALDSALALLEHITS
ncbi:hypothetical protein CLOM_g6853 [Closterium sp. NIES-68]|nr:hypothetical protein CLOM_g6853 [Closterium sp. NIES-68]GJP72389.1 hypothetical protein CLOP_g3127 [Closterium sp. NIES-67]